MSNELLAAALREARQGRPVLPCEPRGKRPIVKHGLRDATIDEVVVKAWWRGWPNANVAVRTGRESGLVVLDVDGEEGTESLRALERQHGGLPRTMSVVTPRGGEHFVFEHPGVEVRNSAGKLGQGLDFRGDGGYVLRPPSVGANGRRYEEDEECVPAPLPGWLLRLVRGPADQQPRVAPASDWIYLVRHGVEEGNRNSELARFVGHLLWRNVHVDLVAELVSLLNAARFRPPLPQDEVERVLESIAERELQRRQGAHQ